MSQARALPPLPSPPRPPTYVHPALVARLPRHVLRALPPHQPVRAPCHLRHLEGEEHIPPGQGQSRAWAGPRSETCCPQLGWLAGLPSTTEPTMVWCGMPADKLALLRTSKQGIGRPPCLGRSRLAPCTGLGAGRAALRHATGPAWHWAQKFSHLGGPAQRVDEHVERVDGQLQLLHALPHLWTMVVAAAAAAAAQNAAEGPSGAPPKRRRSAVSAAATAWRWTHAAPMPKGALQQSGGAAE